MQSMQGTFTDAVRHARLGDAPECRLVPAFFETDDRDLIVVPRPYHYVWDSCLRLITEVASRGVLNRLPLVWQMHSTVHLACRSVGVPVLINEQDNVPVGAVSLAYGGIDTIVSETRGSDLFASYVLQKNLPHPRGWLLVHRYSDVWEIPPECAKLNTVIFQEVHLFPSAPILWQCIELAKGEQEYHLSAAYAWRLDQKTSLSSLRGDPLHLVDVRLPFVLRVQRTCRCGESVVRRL